MTRTIYFYCDNCTMSSNIPFGGIGSDAGFEITCPYCKHSWWFQPEEITKDVEDDDDETS